MYSILNSVLFKILIVLGLSLINYTLNFILVDYLYRTLQNLKQAVPNNLQIRRLWGENSGKWFSGDER